MHVFRKPRAVAVTAPATVPTIVRMAIAVIATATLLFLFSPRLVNAQAATGTHQVQAGESLWSLAVKYYGDGLKWTELARLNELGATGEKGLLVGQTIKTPKTITPPTKSTALAPPANTPHNAVARARQPVEKVAVKEAAPPAGALAAQTAGKVDVAPKPATGASKGTSTTVSKANAAPANAAASTAGTIAKPTSAEANAAARADTSRMTPRAVVTASQAADNRANNPDAVAAASTRIWNIDAASLRAARGKDVSTVFFRPSYDPAETEMAVRAAIIVEKPRARVGEYGSAPYPIDAARISQSGRVGRRAGALGSIRDIERLVLTDEAEVVLPSGVMPAVGAQFVSVIAAPAEKGGLTVARPSGVLEIVRAEAGRPVIARVVRQSGRIEEGQALLPFDGGAVSNSLTTTPVARSASAPETQIIWIEGDALLPTLQSFVVLRAGEREGVKAGDEFELVTRTGLGADAKELRVAIVRVVRVTGLGSTAIVTSQSDAKIAVGGAARLIARAN